MLASHRGGPCTIPDRDMSVLGPLVWMKMTLVKFLQSVDKKVKKFDYKFESTPTFSLIVGLDPVKLQHDFQAYS